MSNNLHSSNFSIITKETEHICSDCRSVCSPAAYMVKLLEIIDKYTSDIRALRKRRPDLYSMKLSCENIDKEKSYLEIINDVMIQKIRSDRPSQTGFDRWMYFFTKEEMPFFLNENLPLKALSAHLRQRYLHLEELYELSERSPNWQQKSIAALIGLSKQTYQRIINPSEDSAYLLKVYKIESLKILENKNVFAKHTGLDGEEVEKFLKQCNVLLDKKESALALKENSIENLSASDLAFIHRYMSLSRALSMDFKNLGYIFLAISKKRIDEYFMEKLAVVLYLEKHFSKDLRQGYVDLFEKEKNFYIPLLYISQELLQEKLKALMSADDQEVQKVLGLTLNELKSVSHIIYLQKFLQVDIEELEHLLKNAPLQSSLKESLGFLFQQIALAKITGFSIRKFCALNALINQGKLMKFSDSKDLTKFIYWSDLLKNSSLDIESLESLVNSKSNQLFYSKQKPRLKALIQGIELKSKEHILHALFSFFDFQREKLLLITDFIMINKGMDTLNNSNYMEFIEELLPKMDLFHLMKFNSEDIDHVIKYYDKIYKTTCFISLNFFEKLILYKQLRGQIGLESFSECIDYLLDEKKDGENAPAVLSSLSQGIKKEMFDQLTAKNSEDTLKNLQRLCLLKTFSQRSGLTADYLIKINALYSYDVKDHWNKFTEIADSLLPLESQDPQNQRLQDDFHAHKRDLLVAYLVFENNENIKDKEDLCAELLIDVEVSKCAKISPLRAALNSMQIYWQRCRMKVEKNFLLSAYSADAFFDQIKHYRSWAFLQKTALYPENFLNPTLQKTISAQYKKFQQSLMHVPMDDKGIRKIYLEFVDELYQMASLEIVDSYFDRVYDPVLKKESPTIFFLGRTHSQPYHYHYSSALLNEQQSHMIYWNPWRPIKIGISSDTATLVYAFHKIFIFWIQKRLRTGPKPFFYTVTIHYIFQKADGHFSTVQNIQEEIEIDITEFSRDIDCYKLSVAALNNVEETCRESLLVTLGDVLSNKNKHFLINENLKVEKKGPLSLESNMHARILKDEMQNFTKAFTMQNKIAIHNTTKLYSFDVCSGALEEENFTAVYPGFSFAGYSNKKYRSPLFLSKKESKDTWTLYHYAYDNKSKIFFEISGKLGNISVVYHQNTVILIPGKTTTQFSDKIDIYDTATGNLSNSQMSQPRAEPTVAVVGDKAIFFGGKTITGFSDKIDIYDTATRNLSNSQMSQPRAEPTVAVVGDKAIFFGGKTITGFSDKIDIYDTATRNLSNSQMSQPRAEPTVAVAGDKAIFFGGKTMTGFSDKIDIYDTKTRNLSNFQMSQPRAEPTVAVVGDKAIFFGGKIDQSFSSKIDIYGSKTEIWKTHDIKEARAEPTVAVVGDKVIFFGGKSHRGISDHIDIYNNSTNEWENKSMQELHYCPVVALSADKVVFFCGKISDAQASDRVDVYDTKENLWTSHKALQARWDANFCVVGHKIVFLGGRYADSMRSKAVDIYDCRSDHWISYYHQGEPFELARALAKDTKAIFVGIDSHANLALRTIETNYFWAFKQENTSLIASEVPGHGIYNNLFFGDVLIRAEKSRILLESLPENSKFYTIRNFSKGFLQKIGPDVFLFLSNITPACKGLGNMLIYRSNSIEVASLPYEISDIQLVLPNYASAFLIMRTGAIIDLHKKVSEKGLSVLEDPKIQSSLKIPDIINGQSARLISWDISKNELFAIPYDIYLWELFFYAPLLISWNLQAQQKFNSAISWINYIINPNYERDQRWLFIPLKKSVQSAQEVCSNDIYLNYLIKKDPLDHAHLARLNLASLGKYVLKFYIDNLLNQADTLLRESSWERFNEAMMIYRQAQDLLGKKKPRIHTESIVAKSYDELMAGKPLSEESPRSSCDHSLSYTYGVQDEDLYRKYFLIPDNAEFTSLWERVQNGLYQLRHCLDPKNHSSKLTPFISFSKSSGSLSENTALVNLTRGKENAPSVIYRFSYMIRYAETLVEKVIYLGNDLLSVLEKKDTEALAKIYNQQEIFTGSLIRSVKEKTLELQKKEGKVLNNALKQMKYRKDYYDKLLSKDLSPYEKSILDLSSSVGKLRTTSASIRIGAVAAYMIPTVFGLADGGFHPGNSLEASANALDVTSNMYIERSQLAQVKANFERRAQEWQMQKELAGYDIEQIEQQIEINRFEQENAQKELEWHQQSIEQMDEKKALFDSKFTKEELYGWMKEQISSLYFQAYNLALKVCKQAENAYQNELNSTNSFISDNSWNSLKAGLIAGHQLKSAVDQMQGSYHEENKRALEISKVISLKQMDPLALYHLQERGECIFNFSEKLFDLDFPGHYNRRIKNIRVTLPVIVGPYEGVHATLVQSHHRILTQADINDVKSLLQSSEGLKLSAKVKSFSSNEQVILSRGQQDGGLFILNFNDERYLPFEGTGALSSWMLRMPKKNQGFKLTGLSDVIIHLDYTADDGGEAFRDEVEKIDVLRLYEGTLALNLKRAFPAEWDTFKKSPEAGLSFMPTKDLFADELQELKLDAGNKIYYFLSGKFRDSAQISLFNQQMVNPSEGSVVIERKYFELNKSWNIHFSGDTERLLECCLLIPYKAKRAL